MTSQGLLAGLSWSCVGFPATLGWCGAQCDMVLEARGRGWKHAGLWYGRQGARRHVGGSTGRQVSSQGTRAPVCVL